MNKKIILTGFLLILLTLTFSNADVQIGGRSRLDTTTGEYEQIQNLKFNDNSVGYIGSIYGYRPIRIDFIRSCESITTFNTKNPNHKVINVTWKITHLYNTYSATGNYQNATELTAYYGCPTSACDTGNTPYGETGGIIRETYKAGHGDNIQITMTTLYNNSDEAEYDSPCTFETRTGTYSCNGGCEEFTYEELVDELEIKTQLNEHSENTTSTLLTVATYNLTLWEISLWVLKMLVVLSIIVGLVSTIFLIYRQIKKARDE
jgi:hypothetical protein